MRKLIFGFVFAGAMIFAGGNLHAESGFLFLKGTHGLDFNFRLTATPVNGSWRYMPGGFLVNLSGGHRFIYRKLGSGHLFQFHRKIGSTYRVYTKTKANSWTGVSYGMHRGKRRFLLTRPVVVFKSGADGRNHHYIQVKRGSVLFK